jgi:hypothetical protein
MVMFLNLYIFIFWKKNSLTESNCKILFKKQKEFEGMNLDCAINKLIGVV